MNSPGGYVYLLYGSDEFRRAEAVRSLKERMRALPAGEHNLVELAGPEATVARLRAAADAMPFLADRRTVIVHGLIGRLQGKGTAGRGGASGKRRGGKAAAGEGGTALEREYAELLQYLPGVPPTTYLAFVEGPSVDVEPIQAAAPTGRALVNQFDLPPNNEMPDWVRKRARLHRVDLDESAVRELALACGQDLRRLDSEIRKLGAYADGRAVTRADVQQLVVGRETIVWALLDALADRRRDLALNALRRLYQQGESPEALLGRDIAPLFRRLLLAKEISLLDRRARSQVDLGALGLNPRTLPRLMEQASRFDSADLERALELLLDLDRQVKTGDTEAEPALELLVVRLCSRLSAPQAVA